ncbi:MAG TPA: sulfite exporter TauE/SafE family protein [Kofleriaceae bacterium]
MIELSFATIALLAVAGVGAGWLGAWIGIGGGIVLVPAFVLGFGLEPKVAVATSLLTVIATSTAAGSVYVGRGQTNTRLAIALEISTSAGGVLGGFVALAIPSHVLAGIFGVVMAATAVAMLRFSKVREAGDFQPSEQPAEGAEQPGSLAGTYYDEVRRGIVHYHPRRAAVGSAIALMAGAVSGLLGVGGGFLKVPAMNLGMDVPIKVAIATSNFMIGVTASASVFIYFGRDFVHPLLVAPVALGVVVGALAGSLHSGKAKHASLKRVIAIVLVVVAIQMGLRAFGVNLGR